MSSFAKSFAMLYNEFGIGDRAFRVRLSCPIVILLWLNDKNFFLVITYKTKSIRGAMPKIRKDFDGSRIFFDGPKGDEYKIRAEFPNGMIIFYEGVKNHEHVVRAELPSNQYKQFYEGTKGQEYTVRAEYANGEIHFFEIMYFFEFFMRAVM